MEWAAIPVSRGIFLSQGSNLGLLYCRQILYHLNHESKPKELREKKSEPGVDILCSLTRWGEGGDGCVMIFGGVDLIATVYNKG